MFHIIFPYRKEIGSAGCKAIIDIKYGIVRQSFL